MARRRYRYRKLLERCVRKNKRFTTAVRQQALLEFNASMRTFDRKLQHHSTATTAGGTYTSNLNTLNVIQIVCQNQRAFVLEQCAINPYICLSGIAEDALNCCPGATCYMTRPEARRRVPCPTVNGSPFWRACFALFSSFQPTESSHINIRICSMNWAYRMISSPCATSAESVATFSPCGTATVYALQPHQRCKRGQDRNQGAAAAQMLQPHQS